MKTKEKLSAVLRDAGLNEMSARAAVGYYDDYESELATPCIQLVTDLRAAGREDLAKRAMNGEWDATREESQEWWEREGRESCPPEMRHLFEKKN
jgi:hypothetical protein